MSLPSFQNPKEILNHEDLDQIEGYLRNQQWINALQKVIHVEKPGEGNMNLVLRVLLNDHSTVILKQARPWVEKFPEILAPVERIQVEHQYYQYTSSHPSIAKYSPSILGFDDVNSVLLMEDLKLSEDFTFVYQDNYHFTHDQLCSIVGYLNSIKKLSIQHYPRNYALRQLNHQHIFELPFSKNNFDLNGIQKGLDKLAKQCQQDIELTTYVTRLGEHYLEGGTILQHGDFYPGSMLKTNAGLKVIDPEFSFLGPEEWDLAILTAHLILSKTPAHLITETFCLADKTTAFNSRIFAGFVGTEVLRRLIGLAQLPLELSIKEKAHLIDQSIDWIKSGKIHTLSCDESIHLSV